MKLLLVAATSFELLPCLNWLEQNTEKQSDRFLAPNLEVIPLITGVGLVSTTYQVQKKILEEPIDLAIQAGIAGTFRKDWPLAKVVQVISERFGDLGAETADQHFLDLEEMGLQEADESPFTGGRLLQPEEALPFLPTAHGISVQKVHGASASIDGIQAKYDPDVESMEGAAFFYVCLLEQIRFLQIRAISNYVEPRNRDRWEIGPAINGLNEVLIGLLSDLVKN